MYKRQRLEPADEPRQEHHHRHADDRAGAGQPTLAVVAASLIARRGVNTLVLVHRRQLLDQWVDRLEAFLDLPPKSIGRIGGGRNASTGIVDVAVIQSLVRKGVVDDRVANYGHLIVDECHHVGAVSFDAILKRTKAKFVLGLTATPIRRDGQQPIIFMQCGPIRYTAAKPAGAPHDLEVLSRSRFTRIDLPTDAGIQDVFRYLANDQARTQAIAAEVRDAFEQGRKALVLTERTEHLDAIKASLDGLEPVPFVLHGRMSRKQRAALVADLDALPPGAPRVLLSPGKLVGEGFDHPPLDTLVLAMPICCRAAPSIRSKPRALMPSASAGTGRAPRAASNCHSRQASGSTMAVPRRKRMPVKVSGPTPAIPSAWATNAEPQMTATASSRKLA